MLPAARLDSTLMPASLIPIKSPNKKAAGKNAFLFSEAPYTSPMVHENTTLGSCTHSTEAN